MFGFTNSMRSRNGPMEVQNQTTTNLVQFESNLLNSPLKSHESLRDLEKMSNVHKSHMNKTWVKKHKIMIEDMDNCSKESNNFNLYRNIINDKNRQNALNEYNQYKL